MSPRRSLFCGVVGLCAVVFGSSARSEPPDTRFSLEGPTLDAWRPEFPAHHGPSSPDDEADVDAVAVITAFEAPLVSRPGGPAVGTANLGSQLPATRTATACDDGRYFRVNGGAYLCSSAAEIIEPGDPIPEEARAHNRPDLDAPTPHRYVKVTRDYAPRFARLPTEAELARIPRARERRQWLDVLERWMNGTYLVAVTGSVEVGDHRLLRTVAGHYIDSAEAIDRPEVEMHGERLGEDFDLPLAFTTGDVKLLCIDGDEARPCGEADKHARFVASGEAEIGDRALIVADQGFAAPAAGLRVARRIDRPEAISARDQWIHINLSEQTLVAYEGDEPVYATLVSSGKRSHATPTGTWRIERMYVTKTMRGHDAGGLYEVQEIPWTMYYSGNFALHGAYWHNNFGNTRSHGCVNIPPADARWLFYWAEPAMPAGWHSRTAIAGPHVVITGRTPPDAKEAGG